MMDFMKMIGQMKDVQAKVKEVREQVTRLQATGESGGGLVKATIDGNKRVLSIAIDDELIKPTDKQMLQDLVAAAINIATSEIDAKIKEEIKKSTDGILPNLPLDFLV